MRITLDLPEALLKQAKITAVERGTTLRELVGTALEKELAGKPQQRDASRRLRFPIVASREPGALRITNAEITAADGEEDARRHGIPP